MKQQTGWDCLWAGMCLMGAVSFMIRGQRVA